jgi:hypothetical protein
MRVSAAHRVMTAFAEPSDPDWIHVPFRQRAKRIPVWQVCVRGSMALLASSPTLTLAPWSRPMSAPGRVVDEINPDTTERGYAQPLEL